MSKQISETVLKKNRKVIVKYGEMLGKELYTVRKVNVDPKYVDKKNSNGEYLVPHLPITRCMIVRIPITSVGIGEDLNGTPMLIFNQGISDDNNKSLEYKCPLTDPMFNIEPTTENILKAIDAQAKNGPALYFSNPEKLTDACVETNRMMVSRLQELLNSLSGQKRSLENSIERDIQHVTEFRRELGEVDEPQDISVSVKVETK